ncbi:hypothetical protein [Vitiosangium sp. GDMCC 1.1324]|uniref:hypothetical protein n=1 Tax=Vitiosangium sp. (strain GDMCC 1.1324) TaxID=2138576 RepID=UPI000D3963BA|nr:hypothetical protein [Vitiosangium sp. GDMCC 1.1324]PTL82069.1 hypothetical protein DAT35_19895 [Vitiosangium sp. GDMCC 1.1324]
MHSNDWNKEDTFTLCLFSPRNPLLDRGLEGLDEVLDFVESLDAQLRPNLVYLSRDRKYSRKLVHERLHEFRFGTSTSIYFARTRPINEELGFKFYDQSVEDTFFTIDLTLRPFAVVREEGRAEERTYQLLSLVRSFAQRFPLSYGLAHSSLDFHLGSDPHSSNSRAPKGVYEAYWLNVYGPRLVEQLGRQRVLSTPSAHLEELPGGAILWLTRPTPADFDSEEARLAQARALVHLRPELKLEDTLATLRQRSLIFTPLPFQFDEDVADILQWEVEARGLEDKRKLVERFNAYHPPPVSEWLPASQAPTPDVGDVQRVIDNYEGLHAEQLVALLHKEIPALMSGSVEAIPRVDFHLWHSGWGKRLPDEEKELLIPALGAWLGMHLVHSLGGRWVPRRTLEESAVVLGDRAWLPFLRARHAIQGRDAPLDSSCTQLFRLAQRLSARLRSH